MKRLKAKPAEVKSDPSPLMAPRVFAVNDVLFVSIIDSLMYTADGISKLPWLIDRTPSILLERSRGVADRLSAQLDMPDFQEILVTQGMRPTSREGDYELTPEDKLPDWFELELLAERRFGTKLARISRLVAVHLPADFKASTPPPVTSGEAQAVAHPN